MAARPPPADDDAACVAAPRLATTLTAQRLVEMREVVTKLAVLPRGAQDLPGSLDACRYETTT
jgi:hypothetical protein